MPECELVLQVWRRTTKIETRRQDYKQLRPHSLLDYLLPAEFARKAAESIEGHGLISRG